MFSGDIRNGTLAEMDLIFLAKTDLNYKYNLIDSHTLSPPILVHGFY